MNSLRCPPFKPQDLQSKVKQIYYYLIYLHLGLIVTLFLPTQFYRFVSSIFHFPSKYETVPPVLALLYKLRHLSLHCNHQVNFTFMHVHSISFQQYVPIYLYTRPVLSPFCSKHHIIRKFCLEMINLFKLQRFSMVKVFWIRTNAILNSWQCTRNFVIKIHADWEQKLLNILHKNYCF